MPAPSPALEPDLRPLGLVAAAALDPRPKYEQARAARVAATTYSGVLTGRVRPSAALRRRIAEALGRPETELFDTEPESAGRT